ncbi:MULTISPECIES: hypothetical protein [Mesorhizobium]|uniref:Uncharacterized protein n=1 Tax=Mesorhizobium huakuii TaxID=28104 RepID=A0ABZ0VMP3_9HYPH|nr:MULTISPECIES: hypothetical protein [Mesorhizobium]MBZ9994185.1 hypothetical protein [Mesorhizobium sp. BH1-1-4]WQB98528.1 hypothetical protein U0R22_002683 [Mesorhizobium huakuii]
MEIGIDKFRRNFSGMPRVERRSAVDIQNAFRAAKVVMAVSDTGSVHSHWRETA